MRYVTNLQKGLEGTVVLLVEDDNLVREILSRVLSDRGCVVLTAGSGREALEQATAWSGPLDLLLCDVVLPDMRAVDVCHRVAAAHDGVRALFMSGYGDDVLSVHGIVSGVRVLPKPFDSAELIEAVRVALETREGA
jgi:two-component system cell cycle sensor histidine kinase/response regulator CckA